MPSYSLSYEKLRQDPTLGAMLEGLERGFAQFGIDYYLVGAVARDAWMSGLHDIAPRKTTADIDFGVFINEKGVYEQLKEYLITHEDFSPVHNNSFVLLWQGRFEVDLMPFGAIADADGKVTVSGTGYTSLHVPGFAEVYQAGLPEMTLEGNHTFKCSTLSGIVLLKLLSWEDRPESRRDDLLDISHILRHFFDIHDEEIWEHHNDLFANDPELLHIAARVLGRELCRIARPNDWLYKRVRTLLYSNSTGEGAAPAIMTTYFQNTEADNRLTLQHLYTGYTERAYKKMPTPKTD